MKELYIHIGRPKVGSSSIQYFLAENRPVLRGQGCLYPHTGIHHKASHGLALVLEPSLPGAWLFADQTPESLYSHLIEEIANSGLDKTVISSEMFYLIEPRKLPGRLKQEFKVKIVCYLRRQDEVLLSSYIQEIKSNQIQNGMSFDEYLNNDMRLALLDYKTILDKWAGVFGPENIITRVYDAKSNIFEDFLKALDMNWNKKYSQPVRRFNQSPARDILDFISQINRFKEPEPVLQELKAPLLQSAELNTQNGKLSTSALLGNDYRRKIMEMFASSNREVAKTYLGRQDGHLFDSAFPEKTAEEYKGIELERFIQMVAKLLVNQQKKMHRLQDQLKTQNERLAALERSPQEAEPRNADYSGGRPEKYRIWLSRIKSKLLG